MAAESFRVHFTAVRLLTLLCASACARQPAPRVVGLAMAMCLVETSAVHVPADNTCAGWVEVREGTPPPWWQFWRGRG